MEEKARYIWFECPVCGYQWRSHGKGKRVVCPKCYENRTGKKLGRSPEHMQKMRELKGKKNDSGKDFTPPEEVTELTPEQQEQMETKPEPKKSILDKIMDFKIM